MAGCTESKITSFGVVNLDYSRVVAYRDVGSERLHAYTESNTGVIAERRGSDICDSRPEFGIFRSRTRSPRINKRLP